MASDGKETTATESASTGVPAVDVAAGAGEPAAPAVTEQAVTEQPAGIVEEAPPAGKRARVSENGESTVVLPSVQGEKTKKGDGVLRVLRKSPKATLPSRGSEWSAGYDLSSAEEATVPARGKTAVNTGLSIAIPQGTYARIAPRSGLASKHSIDVGAGVVDYDYRGEVKVILFNFSDEDFKIKVGDRVAQLILECIVTPPVEEVDELDNTARGAGGFGSTGVSAEKKT